MSNFNGYCFINSVIQILLSSKHFRKEIQKRKKSSVLFGEFSKLMKLMKGSKIVNQIRFLLRLNESYELCFDVFKKMGYVSDVIKTISQICTSENCHIFNFEAEKNLCEKFPIIRSFGNLDITKKVKFANIFINSLGKNKILIFSGNMKKGSSTLVLQKSGHIVKIKGKNYKLFGIVEKVSKSTVHTQAYTIRYGKWYLFSDEYVKQIPQNTVFDEVQPYFAFYERL